MVAHRPKIRPVLAFEMPDFGIQRYGKVWKGGDLPNQNLVKWPAHDRELCRELRWDGAKWNRCHFSSCWLRLHIDTEEREREMRNATNGGWEVCTGETVLKGFPFPFQICRN